MLVAIDDDRVAGFSPFKTCSCYSMSMKTERLQVLIEMEQRARLEWTAAVRGVSVAALVRDAINLVYPPQAEQRAKAAADILAAEPMAVPDPAELRAELDRLRGGD
ncbi:hypothetical protein [Agrococcus sp. KRD186]|uniref:hypothetical protein n=1 Tax=Agrococcus sp. KRD186 TaxID=2729730 RepID=UPI0019D2D6C1|nr:hypothetical protein [Agrococcus sp. KRD186]